MLLQDAPSSGRSDAPPRRRGWLLAAAVVAAALTVAAILPADEAPTSPTNAAPRVDPAAAGDGHGAAPAAPGERPPPEVVGYVPYWQQQAAITDVAANRRLLTTAAPWWYAPTRDGDVVEQHPAYTDTSDRAVAQLRAEGLRLMPTIANHRDGEWDFEVVPALLADGRARARHVRALADLAADRDFDGIVVDYELLRAQDRDAFTAFITALADALHADSRRLAVALHAQRSDAGDGAHNRAQDYAAIGAVVDELHLMTFNQHYDESPPGPIAPLPWVSDVIAYTVARVPAEKVILGIGLFGYDWGGGPVAEDLQLTEVDRRIAMTGGTPAFDERAASPYLRYERDGTDHELWYEDARSVGAKLALVDEHGLGGAFFWRLGAVPDDIWRTAMRRLDPS